MKDEILEFCKEKSILLDVFMLENLSKIKDLELVKIFIEKIKNILEKRFITKELIINNSDKVKKIINEITFNESKKTTLFYELFNFVEVKKNDIKNKNKSKIKLISSFVKPGKKINVEDFINHFRNRYKEFSEILQKNMEVQNLISINKISKDSQGVSIIGMITEKKITKNNNILLEIEDFSGKINVLINSDKKDLIKEGEDISLDSVLLISGKVGENIIFADKMVFPELSLGERKKSLIDESVAFIGDLHYGSNKFLEKSFLNFINYLNENNSESEKIKYLFIVGDLVTGVGNYPNQEKDLLVNDLESQFKGISNLLKKIREDINIIISPGNHDCVRLMEPQPLFNEKYAWPLYELKNVVVTENPAYIKIGERDDFEGFTILTYHGFSYPYYANTVPKLIMENSMNSPEKIMKYILKNRHLAPSHGSNQYFPLEKDSLLIREVPDIFVSGHTHKSAVAYENNILIVSTSTWEGMTSYQEKLGNKPDHCKVPIFNLKTRQVVIKDFEIEEGIKTYKEND